MRGRLWDEHDTPRTPEPFLLGPGAAMRRINAESCRTKARECHSMAAVSDSLDFKLRLEKLANDWLKLAEQFEKQDRCKIAASLFDDD